MINEFRGEYRWLSNFELTTIAWQGKEWPSSEHVYQAMKTLSLVEQEQVRTRIVIRGGIEVHVFTTPGQAKRIGRTITLQPNWNEMRIEKMLEVQRLKYMHGGQLAQKLLDTHPHELVEGNRWNDTFWGVCRGKGNNHLGEILMFVRGELMWQQQ